MSNQNTPVRQVADRLQAFKEYYEKRTVLIEDKLDSLSFELEKAKNVEREIAIKSEIHAELTAKRELDYVAELFHFSLIPIKPIKYVNQNQGSNYSVQPES